MTQRKLPVVSIIIVTYNAEKHLKNCLNSIADQPYPHLDVVIIDGSSTDSTVEIIKSYSSLVSFWLSESDEGIYDAMNKGLKYIKGEWVYFIGSDDRLLPDFSKMLFNELHDANVVYYGSVNFREQRYWGYVSRYMLAKMGIFHQAIVYPASVFKTYQFDTRYTIRADHVLNMQCENDSQFKFMFVDYTIADFNDTGVSSLNEDSVFEQEKYRLIFKYFGLILGIRYWIKGLKSKIRN